MPVQQCGFSSISLAGLDFRDLCSYFFDTVRENLTDNKRRLIGGGEWNYGRGSYNKEFTTYRIVLKPRNEDVEAVVALRDKLLHGLSLVIRNQQVHILSVLAHVNSFFQISSMDYRYR
eukprot:TRINITY_DN35320_c0_g1_i2.p3 TRINITY_DN35320_c0_g1~~TRINITY_DN35320_c0_g1_i2.p3  ORF type:complete len:118 (+),score=3.51 TRINITY_DN35320_c0_g1_i2:120-473(+)